MAATDLYAPLIDSQNANTHVLAMFKSTNNGVTWTQIGVNVKIAQVSEITSLAARKDGALITVLTHSTLAYESRNTIRRHVFSMTTDAWTVRDRYDENTPFADEDLAPIDFAVRADDDLAAAYSALGPNAQRVIWDSATATWGTPVLLTTQAMMGGVVSSGDRMHFGHDEITGEDFEQRTLSGADVLSATNVVDASIFARAAGDPPAVSPGDRASSWATTNNPIVHLYADATGGQDLRSGEWDDVDDPSATDGTSAISTTLDPELAQDWPWGMVVADGETPELVHAIWIDDASQDIQHATAPESGTPLTWTVQSEIVDAVTANSLTAGLVTHGGGKVIAILYDNAGTVTYAEVVFAAPDPAIEFAARAYDDYPSAYLRPVRMVASN